MALMINEVSISNQALTWLGQQRINSLDDDLDTARWMDVNFEPLRDAVLEEGMWTFATVRATSTTADLDPWGVQYAHSIPTGWMAVFRVYNDVSATLQSDYIVSPGWTREGDRILSVDETVYMYGVEQVKDTGKFSNLFAQALAARLAADGAIPFTKSRQLQIDMWELYNAKLARAFVRDGQQGTNETIRRGPLTRVR
jgi:hypothetical protein